MEAGHVGQVEMPVVMAEHWMVKRVEITFFLDL